ncbi:hypothetical protein F4678DRAFT_481108 [Xylaria arbuscula]|nr:hypothetical protein F4678DRAFT_481108 [Xylaria arbuscula]
MFPSSNHALTIVEVESPLTFPQCRHLTVSLMYADYDWFLDYNNRSAFHPDPEAASDKGSSDDDNHTSDPDTKAYELRLWPPQYLQAYCLDHFMMECEIYHEQETDRYNKLVTHSREKFFGRQNTKKLPSQPMQGPTRRQPSRRAKEKHSIVGAMLSMRPPGPPKPKRPSNVPFKPAKLEKAFRESQEGAMCRILTKLYEELEMQKSWEDYRLPLKNKIQEITDRLKSEAEEGRNMHPNCVFRGPLEIECRYCGFVDMIREDEAATPRKLAPPAAMRAIERMPEDDDAKESRLAFRGTEFIVDVCGEKTMIVLVRFKGLLDLCAELFEEGDAVPDSPTSLFARLRSMKPESDISGDCGVKRQSDEPKSSSGHKRRKSAAILIV